MLLQADMGDATTVFATAGWQLRPEGACRGEVCVPVGDAVTVEEVAVKLAMPVVESARGLRALGPSSLGGRALTTVAAPALELPLALNDDTWQLATQRGRRTVMVAWAPW